MPFPFSFAHSSAVLSCPAEPEKSNLATGPNFGVHFSVARYLYVSAPLQAANLLMASQSPAAFVQSCLEKRKDSEITAVDLYGHYQDWCIQNGVRPFASQAFTQIAKEEIELKLGLRYRHDLGDVEGTNRGSVSAINYVFTFTTTMFSCQQQLCYCVFDFRAVFP